MIENWNYPLLTKSTFAIWSEKYYLQQKYWLRLVALKPFKHISKLKRETDNMYLFDILKPEGNRIFKTLTIQPDKVEIKDYQ